MENILNFDDIFEEAFNFEEDIDVDWDMSNFLEESIEEDSYTMEEFMEDVSVTSYICSDYIEESVSDVLGGIISKIRAFFAKMVEKFSNFIHKKAIKTKIENAKKMVAKSGIGKKKVTTIDYKKLSKLQQSTIDALGSCKSADDVDRVMAEYSKRRKALFAKTAAVTVSVMALLTGAAVLVKNHSKGLGSLLKKGEGALKKAFNFISSKFPKKEKALEGEETKKGNFLKSLLNRIGLGSQKVASDATKDASMVVNEVLGTKIKPGNSKVNSAKGDFVDLDDVDEIASAMGYNDDMGERTLPVSKSNYHPNASKKYSRKKNETINPASGAGSDEFWAQFD